MAIEYLSKHKAKLVVSVGSASKGTRKRVTKTVEYKRKKELEKLYQAFEDEVRRNPLTSITVDGLIEAYIDNCAVRGLSANTLHGYKSAEKRLNSAFKGVLARELATYQIDDFIVSMAKKYAPKTIENTIGLLDAAYTRAVRSGQLAENPCVGITMPKKRKKEIKTLPPEQIREFMELLEQQTLDIKVGYELCLLCGLRRGEVLGLRESDINLMFRQLTVRRTRYVVEKKKYVQDAKTEKSHRTLAIPKLLADDIDQLIREHRSKPFDCSDYLVQNAFGEPLSPSQFSSKIVKMEKAAGLDHVTAHGLRHTFATILNANHIDSAQISAELGHSNLATTLNIYTHVFGDVSSSSKGIADTIDDVFSKKGANEARTENEKTAEA